MARREAALALKRAERLSAAEAKRKAKRRRPRPAPAPARAGGPSPGAVLAAVALGLVAWSVLLLVIEKVLAPSPPFDAVALALLTGAVVLGTKRVLAYVAGLSREPRVRVAAEPSRPLRVAEAVDVPVVACAECEAPIAGEPASCALCVDPLHAGACAEQHEARHRGAAGGRLYR